MADIDKIRVKGTEYDVHDAGAVRHDTATTLNAAAKAQARENIGAISYEQDPDHPLTEAQKEQARNNIGATDGAVLYKEAQSDLTFVQRQQARENIKAVPYEAQDQNHELTAAEKDTARANIGAVSYEQQNLTEAQKAQARENIGATDGAVLYKEAQGDLTSAQREQARENIKSVSYEAPTNQAHQLTDAEKTQARHNLGADDTFFSVHNTRLVLSPHPQGILSDAVGNYDWVLYDTPQSLEAGQKQQARENIGAVSYEQQNLTEAQKSQARENIGASEGAVSYQEAQNLDTNEKTQARENIAAVSYETQSLTDDQKRQARENIGASDGAVLYKEAQILNENYQAQARQNINAANATDLQRLQNKINDGVVVNVEATDNGLEITYLDGSTESIEIGNGIENVDYDSENYLHFYDKNGDELFDGPFFIEGGGGGGGTGGGQITITRITGASVDCVYGERVYIQFNYQAVDSSGDTVGDGECTWSVGGIVVARNITIKQGNNSFDITPYLTSGQNNVRLSVSVNVGGDTPQVASKQWTINAVNMYFNWAYDDAQINTSALVDRWTPYGDIAKTTHTMVDGVELETITTTRSGVPQSLTIPMQTHGAHTIERWLSAEINGVQKTTARQYHEAIFVVDGNTTPVVAISMGDQTINQYDTIQIPVVIYDPSALLTTASLTVDGTQIGTWENVDRSLHYWAYTPTVSGEHVLTVTCGNVHKDITIVANEVDIDAEEVQDYSFRLKASEFASNSAVEDWTSNGVNATFSQNFDWINGGLHTETDNSGSTQQYLCIKAGTRMTINHTLFATDPKANGMNIKIVFKVTNCRNYDAQIAHCYADNVGLRMYAHEAILNSSGTAVSVPYGEDEYIELEYDVYPAPKTENDNTFRYIMAWMDGVITSCRVYGQNDNFVQTTLNKEGIVIGSDDCDVYVYMIKAYPMLIDRNSHILNFIMDAPNANEMIRRYNRNNILDETGDISYEKQMQQNPNCRVWLYDIPYLTNDKKDKVRNCAFHQFWPNGDQYYQLSGVGTMTVQGTSSVKYIRGAANTDINFTSLEDGDGNDLMANGTQDETYGNNWYIEDSENPGHAKVYTVAQARTAAGLTDENEELGPEWIVVTRDANRTPTHYIKALGYKINDTSCPITYSNTKVNFASCEQVNNMCNAIWYQRFNPYPSLTPHDCMEFSMGVQFIKDSGTVPDDAHFVLWGDNKYHMYSIANMGNSKKNVHVFHDLSNPNEVCVEVNDNNADQMRMINDDLSAEDWSGDVYFGMRYPDTKNPSQAIQNAWQRLVSWFAHNDLSPYDAEHHIYGYTGEQLATPETYGNYTFRGHDRSGTQVLRGTVVKQYAGTYTHDTFNRRMAKMLSECEDYLVMDSFLYHFVYLERHTMVDNVSKNNFWSSTDLIHWDLSKAYDMDTSDGNNNQGQMMFDYGNEYNDINVKDGKNVFNGSDSVWFVFCANLYEACQTMFTNREAAGAWSATAYHNFLLAEQQKVPERCWVECYWYDYLRTYEQSISDEWMTFLDGGQKTHQRRHYEFFEELYDSSKYRGSVSTVDNINFRAYKPSVWAGVEPKSQITITMYNKMYISLEAGTTAITPIKAQRGVPYTINFPVDIDVGGTLVAINTASMIQAVSGMEQLYPDTCVFSMATRLRELTIGSTETGYSNTFLRTLALGNNTMLERLEVQNLPNANSVLDLTHCPALLYVDATGSGFTGYEFADGGLLEEAILEKPTSLSLRNLAYLTDDYFTINDLSVLATLRYENIPGVDSLELVNNSAALQIVRLIGIDWRLANTALLDALYYLQGLNESNNTIARSVLAGRVYVPTMRQRNLDQYNEAWPNLTVNYDSMVEQYAVRFCNVDGTAIKDIYGQDYVQYIDRGSTAYDPVGAGEVQTPTIDPDEQYTYSFDGWTGLSGVVLENKTITAHYTPTIRTYTVRWFARRNDTNPIRVKTNQAYGTEVKYDDEDPHAFPELTDEEGAYTYNVFNGWNKSTGYIRGDTDVYAIWDRAQLPRKDDQIPLKDMSVAQIAGVVKAVYASRGQTDALKANDYWSDEGDDYIDIPLGRDFNFENVESRLLAQDLYLDGNTCIRFDGHDEDHPVITLFDADAPSFTLAVDYEFVGTASNATLIGAYVPTGNEGFRLRYNSNYYPEVQWGDKVQSVGGYSGRRAMVVLRHQKGSEYLYIAYNNITGDRYPDAVTTTQLARTRNTSTDAVLSLGGVPDGTNGNLYYANGWIHWCKIWYDDLGITSVKELACWSHETLRMQYIGGDRYRFPGVAGDKAAASFLASAPLPFLYYMNSTTRDGGWGNSNMRTFVNGRVFDALPYSWQSLIKTVRITMAMNSSSDLAFSEDKLYIPTYAEIASTSTEWMLAETGLSSSDSLIKWYTSNRDRMKFPGIIIPDDARVYNESNDPAGMPEIYQVKDGDIWNRNGNYYIYVNPNIVSKHRYLGYYYVQNGLSAYDGGRWLYLSNQNWYLRILSPYYSTNGYYYAFYYVYSYGSITYGSYSSNMGCLIGFSL